MNRVWWSCLFRRVVLLLTSPILGSGEQKRNHLRRLARLEIEERLKETRHWRPWTPIGERDRQLYRMIHRGELRPGHTVRLSGSFMAQATASDLLMRRFCRDHDEYAEDSCPFHKAEP